MVGCVEEQTHTIESSIKVNHTVCHFISLRTRFFNENPGKITSSQMRLKACSLFYAVITKNKTNICQKEFLKTVHSYSALRDISNGLTLKWSALSLHAFWKIGI